VGPANLEGRVHIIGCGATGSFVAECAARMGFLKFTLYDADIVEPHNLANQRYEPSHIGRPKVEALKEVLMRFNPDIQVEVHNEFFTSSSKITDIGPLVLTTDTMKSRDEIIRAVANNPMVDHVFETRLGFTSGSTNIIDNLDTSSVQGYLNTIVDDASVPEGPCNQRICTTLVQTISGYVVHQMCEMYSARTKNETWKSPKKQLFELLPKLSTYAL
jgi:hypothetical protein